MNEALERVAESYGCFIESSEGDPCDLFLVQALNHEAEKEP